MRFLVPLLVAVSQLVAGVRAADAPLERYDALLGRYASAAGVRYAAWREDPADRAELDALVELFRRTDPASLGREDRLALYINLYNAKTLQLVLDGNPADSIRELSKARFGFGIFFKKLLEFDGETISLNALEKRLREESADPRVHFAINCASRSCPALLDEAYRGERLEQQLEHGARAFLRRADALRVEQRPDGPPVVRLSKIFDWYAKDFGGTPGVRRFLETYAPDAVRPQLDGGFRIAYLDYDWSLNRHE